MKPKNTKRYICIALAALILCSVIGAYAVKEIRLNMAISYLEKQKKSADTEQVPLPVKDFDGRYIQKHICDAWDIDMIISWLENVSEVRVVEDIPELDYPHVYVGDKMSGNNEKLYYSKENKIFEFTLNETDSKVFLLYITQYGTPYPEVKEWLTEGVILQLQDEIDFGDKDILTFAENGEVASIEIKTPETAEVFFKCIRECTHICDLTGVQFSTSPPPRVIIKGTYADFGCIYLTYKVTGRYYCISYSDENEEYFYNYVMGLKE